MNFKRQFDALLIYRVLMVTLTPQKGVYSNYDFTLILKFHSIRCNFISISPKINLLFNSRRFFFFDNVISSLGQIQVAPAFLSAHTPSKAGLRLPSRIFRLYLLNPDLIPKAAFLLAPVHQSVILWGLFFAPRSWLGPFPSVVMGMTAERGNRLGVGNFVIPNSDVAT